MNTVKGLPVKVPGYMKWTLKPEEYNRLPEVWSYLLVVHPLRTKYVNRRSTDWTEWGILNGAPRDTKVRQDRFKGDSDRSNENWKHCVKNGYGNDFCWFFDVSDGIEEVSDGCRRRCDKAYPLEISAELRGHPLTLSLSPDRRYLWVAAEVGPSVAQVFQPSPAPGNGRAVAHFSRPASVVWLAKNLSGSK